MDFVRLIFTFMGIKIVFYVRNRNAVCVHSVFYDLHFKDSAILHVHLGPVYAEPSTLRDIGSCILDTVIASIPAVPDTKHLFRP